MTPEGRPKKEIKEYLASIGAYVFSPVQMGYGRSTLDLLCCVKGRFVAIEVKVKGKKPTLRQQQTIYEIKNAGGLAILAYSKEDVSAVLY